MIITRKKLYNGFFEVRSYEREKALKLKKPVILVLEKDGQTEQMTLTYHQLLHDGQFINTQYSKYYANTYGIWGYQWKPEIDIDQQVSINMETRQRLAEIWKKIAKN